MDIPAGASAGGAWLSSAWDDRAKVSKIVDGRNMARIVDQEQVGIAVSLSRLRYEEVRPVVAYFVNSRSRTVVQVFPWPVE
jgi:hypothetical protein